MLKLKRIYDTHSKEDGYRILVDRLWPRGISKEEANVDLWLKDIAPSNELRKWFHHEEKNWVEFKKRYIEELDKNAGIIEELKKIMEKHKVITLLYGAKDTEHNQAIVLREYVEK